MGVSVTHPGVNAHNHMTEILIFVSINMKFRFAFIHKDANGILQRKGKSKKDRMIHVNYSESSECVNNSMKFKS